MDSPLPDLTKTTDAPRRMPWRRRLFRFAVPLGIVAAGVVLAASLIATRPEVEPVKVVEKAWLVDVAEVTPGTFSPRVPLYGRVESLWSSQLTAGITADVAEVSVIEGDLAAKGDLLVALDDTDVRLLLAQREAELAEAEARIAAERIQHQANLDALPRERQLLALTEAELSRAVDLREKGAGSQSTLDTARQAVERQAIAVSAREQAVAGHEATQAELEAKRAKAEALRDQARLELERSRVTAPFDGRIARVLVAPGKRVRLGDPLVEIYDTAALVIRALLPARYLPDIRDAQSNGQALAVAGSVEGREVRGRLLRFAGEVQGGGVEGLFLVEAGAELLQQGRFVRFDLALPAQQNLIALPYEAVYAGNRVYRIDEEDRLRAVAVERVGELRAQDETLTLIRSDALAAGDRVVSTQLPNAVDGLLIRVASAAGAD